MSFLNYKLEEKNLFIRIIIYFVVMFLLALNFNLFYSELNLVIGGAGGVALIVREITNIDTSITVLIVYIIILILNFIFLDFEKSVSLIICTILYPLFLSLTSNITDIIVLNYSDKLMICVVAGICEGFLTGIIYKLGFNPGGVSVISQIIAKYFKKSVSKVNFTISAIIILAGGYFFGVSMILYAIIVVYTVSILVDKVLLGISSSKYVLIVTSKEKEIEDFIMNELHHGITKISCETGFSLIKKYVISCSVPTKDYYALKEGIKFIDSSAFITVTDTYETKGGI